MERWADSDGTGDPESLAIAAWRDDPSDRRALTGVRAELLARYTDAVQSGVEGLDELVRAASNLIDRVGDGTVEPNQAVVAALADAAGRIGDPARAKEAGVVDDVVTRLDVAASGFGDLEVVDARGSEELPPDQPPLLTVRHDGTRVKPGFFETDARAGDARPSELPVLVDAWKAIGDHLRGQMESLRSIADTNPDPEVRRVAIALQGAVEIIERLNRTLANYASRVGD